MTTDKQMHTQEVTTFEVVSVLGPYAGMESYSIAAFMGTEQEPYAFVAEKIKSKAVANLFASAPILQHQRDTLLEALKVAKESIEEATRLSALYNGHEYSFSSAMQKICAAIQSAGGNHE